MRKVLSVFVAGAFVVGVAGVAQADDHEGPNFTFGASTSFVFDINEPDVGNAGHNSTFYANNEPQDESFNIDLISLGLDGQRGNLSYEAQIVFGDLAPGAGDSADGDVSVQKANITYDFDGGVAATAGRFGTPIGIEVLEPWGNPIISRSYGWNAQPINHDGVMVSGSADIVDIMVGAVNNFTVADPAGNDVDDEKGIIASIGAGLSDELNLYLSGIFTEEGDTTDVTMGNIIISGDLDAGDSGVSYAVEGNWRENDVDGGGTTEFKNVALYVGTDVGPVGLDVRVDYTDDEGIVTPIDTKVWTIAVVGSIPVTDGVDFRVEYRHDDADDAIYGDEGGTEDAADIVQAQLVWHPSAD